MTGEDKQLADSAAEDRKLIREIAGLVAASEKRISNLEARADKTENSN